MGNKNGYFIALRNKKKNILVGILINGKKEVKINFGDENWFNFEDIKKIEEENKKFDKKNYEQTLKVIQKSKDYHELARKFYYDFKKDREAEVECFAVHIGENGRYI